MKNRKYPSHRPKWLDSKLDQIEEMYKKQKENEPHLMKKREFVQRMTKDMEKKQRSEECITNSLSSAKSEEM